ncbi:Polyamine oxidase 1 [Cladobotryum mycophilum]|uniref:Polyamine oxidase 1 n=1 Tax=Cladobotryum mycophilum TaxID=491253 RepID=A0ABR0S828_9HYPO
MALRSSLSVIAAVLVWGVEFSLAVLAVHGPSSACKQTTVAILGGGIAGITAAASTPLRNASISDFVIIEYRDTLGGRVYQTNFGKQANGTPYVIEYGANWIEGLGDDSFENPIWALAQKYNLANTYSNTSSILTYNETGFTDYSDLLDEYEESFTKASASSSVRRKKNLQDQTVRAGLALAGWNPRHNDMFRQVVDWWSWDFEYAFPPEQSSFIFGLDGSSGASSESDDYSNLVVDSRGYSYIFKQEAATFLTANDSRLLLNTQVTNITYSNDNVTIYNSDGSCVEAKYAICTFSLGVLQNNVVTFKPELPQWKQESIAKFAMGTFTKIFLQFDDTFWPKDKQFFLYASPTTRGYYPVWQSLSTEGFLPNSNIIFATVVADEAYRVEQQTDEETKAECLAVLREMFPNATIPEPTAFTYERWTQVPWAYGSYSNWPAGTTLETHQNLRANVGRLWFAGEATSTEFFGLLHGAWFEGQAAGAEVAAKLQNRCIKYDGVQLCGKRKHYDKLKGTSPLKHYTAANGWGVAGL